jgi:hypothetical protein
MALKQVQQQCLEDSKHRHDQAKRYCLDFREQAMASMSQISPRGAVRLADGG